MLTNMSVNLKSHSIDTIVVLRVVYKRSLFRVQWNHPLQTIIMTRFDSDLSVSNILFNV